MRTQWFLGVVVAGVAALSSHGEPLAKKPRAPARELPDEAKKQPDELEGLNTASRKMYAAARARGLASIPVVIIVSGDELVLRKNGKRTGVTVVPAEYPPSRASPTQPLPSSGTSRRNRADP